MATRPTARRRSSRRAPGPEIRAKCFLVADATEESGGKVFVLGAGWDQLTVPSVPVTYPSLAVVIVLSLPQSAELQRHQLTVKMMDSSGRSVLANPISATRGAPTLPAEFPDDPGKAILYDQRRESGDPRGRTLRTLP